MKQPKKLILVLLASALAFCSQADNSTWRNTVDNYIAQGEFIKAESVIQSLPKKTKKVDAESIDSLRQIMSRIRTDFRITPEEGLKQVRTRVPNVTDAQIESWKKSRKIETMTIDGKEWWFRKAVKNLWLLADEFSDEHKAKKATDYSHYHKYYLDAMKTAADVNSVRNWNRVHITFTLDVKADAVPAGETLRVWAPYPFENMRQRNITLDKSSYPVTFSKNSKHHTAYMEAKAVKGQPTHFEISFSYEVGERHIAQQDVIAMLEPYDKNSDIYKKYTASEAPHVIITEQTRQLADSIIGDEKNPVLQASKIFNWISANFPWAGAREYSTFSNIPQYVLLNHHGDCGQVALLYITLVRSIGIPARWESGYMLHPGEVGYHDWSETYFEGVGWVSTDPSFGRMTYDTPMQDYYTTGIDVYRLATNEGTGDRLDPVKKYIRSETVDFQPGEVEWKGGNLYYDKWDSDLKVDSFEKIE